MEYYVLTQNSEIMGVFLTIEESLTWKPELPLEGCLILYRIRKLPSGQFKSFPISIQNKVYTSETNDT
jgi:hypothetical protein